MSPHTKNQILAHLAEAERLLSGSASAEALDMLDALVTLKITGKRL